MKWPLLSDSRVTQNHSNETYCIGVIQFQFLSLYLDMFDQNHHFCAQSFIFDQTYLNTGLTTQNVRES